MTFPTPDIESQLLMSSDYVFGVDEVGRGAIAGPVVVGVCLISKMHLESWPPQIRDSKMLSERTRNELAPQIQNWAPCTVGLATVAEIETHGITASLALAAKRGILRLAETSLPSGAVASVLLDGTHNWLAEEIDIPVRVEKKADQNCVSVAAASVVAKVYRDELMVQLAATHPDFEWQGNKGYASSAHVAALQSRGPTAEHRVSWLSKILSDGQLF